MTDRSAESPTKTRSKRPADALVAHSSCSATKKCKGDDGGPTWSDLRPELIGHVSRYLSIGRKFLNNGGRPSDVMRLLLCIDRSTHAVVKKMYLTGNDYYLWFWDKHRRLKSQLQGRNIALTEPSAREKEAIKIWLDYNEETWKKRCKGQTVKGIVHSTRLASMDATNLGFKRDFRTGFYRFTAHSGQNDDVLKTFTTKNCDRDLVLTCAAGRDAWHDPFDRDFLYPYRFSKMIADASSDADGAVSVQFMRSIDALLADPRCLVRYDLVDVLRFQIEQGVMDPSDFYKEYDESSKTQDSHQKSKFTLSYVALRVEAIECFRYLLSLPSFNVNAPACFVEDWRAESLTNYHRILNACVVLDYTSSSFLEAVLGCQGVDLDARDPVSGTTALFGACTNTTYYGDRHQGNLRFWHLRLTKIRMLFEAGADPRIPNRDGDELWPLDLMDSGITYLMRNEAIHSRGGEGRSMSAVPSSEWRDIRQEFEILRDEMENRERELDERDQQQQRR